MTVDHTILFPPGRGNAGDVLTTNGAIPVATLSWTTLSLPTGYVDGLNVQWNSVSQVQIVSGTCRNSTNSFNLVLAVTTTITITTVGTGGLQTGSAEAASQWYKCLVIGDTTGVNATNVLLVPQGTAFSESGYNVFRLVGYVRNSAASNFIRFTLHGASRSRHYTYEDTRTLLTMFNGFATTANTFQTLNIAAFTPENTSRLDMCVRFDLDADSHKLYLGSGINNQVIPGEVLQILGLGINTALGEEWDTIVYNLALNPTGPSFDWATTTAGNFMTFVINAFILNL